jgi:glycosyltransferase involved in cell wall biosynthesis
MMALGRRKEGSMTVCNAEESLSTEIDVESEPRYSIVITCYNQRQFIRAAIDSALVPRSKSKEIIIVDDGSSDGSPEILKEYAGRVTVIALAQNGGVYEARNRGAKAAKGEYLLFLDGDDLLTPWSLEIYDQIIQEFRPSIIVGTALWFEGAVPAISGDSLESNLKLVEYESLMARDRKNASLNGALLIKRSAFEEVGGWTPGIWQLDIQDLSAKLGYSGKAIQILAPFTMLYRMHSSNSTLLVEPYVSATYAYIRREKTRKYAPGRRKAFETNARHGGVVQFCVRKLLTAGLYGDAVGLIVHGWLMISCSILRKLVLLVTGGQPVQTRPWLRREKHDLPLAG